MESNHLRTSVLVGYSHTPYRSGTAPETKYYRNYSELCKISRTTLLSSHISHFVMASRICCV